MVLLCGASRLFEARSVEAQQAPAQRANPTAGQPPTAQRPAPLPAAPAAPTEDPAPPPAARTVHLADAEREALAQQPRLAAARAELDARRLEASVPSQRWYPRLGGTAQLVAGSANNTVANWLNAGGAAEFPRLSGTPTILQPSQLSAIPYPSATLAVSLEQRLWDFGRTAAEQALSDARVEQANQQLELRRLDVALTVREGYFAVLGAHSVLRAAQAALERTRVHRDALRAAVAADLRPRVDLDRAEAEVARYELGRARALQGLRVARTALAGAVGARESELDAAEEPGAEANTEDPAAVEAALERTVQEAAAQDPALAVLRAELRARQAETRMLSAELLPELRLAAGVLGSSGGAAVLVSGGANYSPALGLVPWVPDYFVGIVLNWRFFDAVALRRRRVAAARESVAEAELTAAREERRRAVEQAWVELRAAREAIPALHRLSEAAATSYAQVEGRFREGLATIVELSDAQLLRTQAELQEAEGRFALARARARFTRALAQRP